MVIGPKDLPKFIKQIVSIFQDLLLEIPGVYCILFTIFDITIAIRDRYGNRPLCFGYNINKDFYLSKTSL